MNTTLTLNLHKIDHRKVKAKSSLVIDLLKSRGIPGGRAAAMYHINGGEYLIKKVFMLDFFMEKYLHGDTQIKDTKRWLQACITNDYTETEDFNGWFKRKKEYIAQNGSSDLRQLLSV